MKSVDKGPLIINTFGGPGLGKSTVSAGIFYCLKRMQVSCELVTEFAKDMVWEKHEDMLRDQIMVFANQHRRIERLRDQVDVVVTDSPFIMGITYASDRYKHLPLLMTEAWHSFDNVNILLERSTTYDPRGRVQTEDQAVEKDHQIRQLLDTLNIEYDIIDPSYFHDASVHIVDTIIRPRLKERGYV